MDCLSHSTAEAVMTQPTEQRIEAERNRRAYIAYENARAEWIKLGSTGDGPLGYYAMKATLTAAIEDKI